MWHFINIEVLMVSHMEANSGAPHWLGLRARPWAELSHLCCVPQHLLLLRSSVSLPVVAGLWDSSVAGAVPSLALSDPQVSLASPISMGHFQRV